MISSTKESVKSTKQDRDILTSHIAWMVCLAKLKELENGKSKVPEYLCGNLANPDFSCLFNGKEADFEVTPEQWQRLFCRGVIKKDSAMATEINTLYQCQNFYGLNAPNNPAQRLTRMVEGIPTKTTGKYDINIQRWGAYAKSLVIKNNGWENFLSSKSLAALQDVHWIDSVEEKEIGACNGQNRRSLIQRILHLNRERYIQILTTPVAALWPVWFLSSSENIEVLRKITDLELSEKDFRVGNRLPDRKLFIDINPSIGRMEGLPYPFGFADALLAEGLKENPEKLKELNTESWPTEAVNIIAEKLKGYFWSPPILFPIRSNIFPTPSDEKKNYPVPFLMLAEGCDTFPSIHSSNSKNSNKQDVCPAKLNINAIRFVSERRTYGEKIAKELGIFGTNNVELLSRKELAKIGGSNCEGIDILASYFPVNILAHVNDDLEELSKLEIYNRYQENGDAIIYKSLTIYLAGGMFLARQPKGIDLIIDLVNYLQKVQLILDHVKPNWKSLKNEFKGILYSSTHVGLENNTKREIKESLAAIIRRSCKDVASNTKLCKEGVTDEDTVFNRLSGVGKQMISALIPEGDKSDNDLREAMLKEMENWGWAIILEAAQYTSIYISSELFGGVKK
jgi:hypothetical protein